MKLSRIRWQLIIAAVFVFQFVSVVPALASRPPLSEQELMKQSDLIIEVNVLSLTKIDLPNARFWRAMLCVEKTLKGKAPSTTMPYDFLPPTPGFAGEINTSVYAGERLWMYLIFEQGQYVAWASNSIESLADFPESR